MKRAGISTVVFLCAAISSVAQEIWLRPNKYFFEKGEQLVVEVQRGPEFFGEPLPLIPGNIRAMSIQNAVSSEDIRSRYTGADKSSVAVTLNQEGAYLLRMQLTRSFDVDPKTFEAFANQYGITDVDKSSSAKINLDEEFALAVRTGRTNGNFWKGASDKSLEIIPDKNPQTLKRGDPIRFTILEDGKPAFGVRVVIRNRWNNRTTIQNIYTEKNGTVSTHISSPGDWMVSVVKLKKTTLDNVFDGYRYNLLFGYR